MSRPFLPDDTSNINSVESDTEASPFLRTVVGIAQKISIQESLV